MANRDRTKASELEDPLPTIAAMTACAGQMLAEATDLLERLETLWIPEPLGDESAALTLSLYAEAMDVLTALKELCAEKESGYLDAAEVQRVLTEIDTRMARALVRLVDLSGRLENAAKTDERCEPANVTVMETASRLLQGFQQAQAATPAVRVATGFGRGSAPVRMAAAERLAGVDESSVERALDNWERVFQRAGAGIKAHGG